MKPLFAICLISFAVACNGQDSAQLSMNGRKSNAGSSELTQSFAPSKSALWFDEILNQKWRRPTEPAQVSKYIRTIYQDKGGSFWLGTNSDGVVKMRGGDFEYFTVDRGLSGATVRAVWEGADSAMWFATNNGLTYYKKGLYKRYSANLGTAYDEIWSMKKDRSGRVWLGTAGGVLLFNGNTFTKFELPLVKPSVQPLLSKFLVWSIAEDQEGNIWFGTDGSGAYKYNGKSIQHIGKEEGLASDIVTSIIQDRTGTFWFASQDAGVTKYSHEKYTRIGVEQGLCHSSIWNIYEDRSGTIWFASLGGGVSKYNGSSFTNFKETKGLTRNHVQCIFEDANGNIWLGFSGGLFRLDSGMIVNIKRMVGC